jgi:4-hydroxythreonine-4-phosphate dehydrogenase
MTPSKLPLLAITMGDPAGVGPEIIVKALARPRLWKVCRPLVIGVPEIMEKARASVGGRLPVRAVRRGIRQAKKPEIRVLPATPEILKNVAWGRLDPRCGRAQVDFIRKAVEMASAGKVHGVVTCPIHKEGLRDAGVAYPGHTEMLADWTGAPSHAMMLVGEHLRVVPVTLHSSLKEAIAGLCREGIERAVGLTHRALRDWFGFPSPRMAVAGLNPHAGDGGLFGSEEEGIIRPAVQACRDKGIPVEGPFSPDAVFRMAADGRFDAVIAMYHDQGLIPLKLLDRDNAVNLTLGLPIIRTSVDHGTAYDIAGTGQAAEGSLVAAILMAARLASMHFALDRSEPADRGRKTGSAGCRTPNANP